MILVIWSKIQHTMLTLIQLVVYHGGNGASPSNNVIDFITIATTGNAQDFGDSPIKGYGSWSCSSQTRGIMGWRA